MKILVVDNHSKHIPEIVNSFDDSEVHVVDVLDLSKQNISIYDCFVLSGSSQYSVLSHLDLYSSEINLIKTVNKPILGICLGFELICYAFNEKLILNKERINCELDIIKISEDRIFDKINFPISVYEAHRWVVLETTKLNSLAKSKSNVEIVKHPVKSIYGFQFHPETITEHQQQLINNFLKIAK
jgi:anthranilate/para-aminobenzoate synthase component II